MDALFQSPTFHALGWTLIHSLWQGAMVFTGIAIVLRLLAKSPPNRKYALACAALGAMLLLPIGTFARLAGRPAPAPVAIGNPWKPHSGATLPRTLATPTPAPADVLPTSPPPTELSWPMEAPRLSALWGKLAWLAPWAVLGWLSGVLCLSLRLVGGWCWLCFGIKRKALPPPSEWQWCVDALARALGVGRKVRLLVSQRIEVPLVAGWVAPVVLMPAAALLHLSPQALEAVLAHELAHVRRHDFLVNLAQSAAEVLLFYHPATWWLSRQIRELREHCCDDLAALHSGGAVAYAKALADLETLRAEPAPLPAPAANGAPLMKRIQRLLNITEPAMVGLRPASLAIGVASVLGAGALWGLGTDVALQEEKHSIVFEGDDRPLDIKKRLPILHLQDPALGEGEGEEKAIEIVRDKNGEVHRFRLLREGDGVKTTYTVNGLEVPLDAEAEEWIKNVVGDGLNKEHREHILDLGEDGRERARIRFYEIDGDGECPKLLLRGVKRPLPPIPPPDFDAEGIDARLGEVGERLKDLDGVLKGLDLDALTVGIDLDVDVEAIIERVGKLKTLEDFRLELPEGLALRIDRILGELPELSISGAPGEDIIVSAPNKENGRHREVRIHRLREPLAPEAKKQRIENELERLKARMGRLQEELEKLEAE